MVLVRGTTYRIERTAPSCYSVVRLLDDTLVGTFRTVPTVRIETAQIDLPVLREVVRAALRSARTSTVMNAVPRQPLPEEPSRSDADQSGSVPVVQSGSQGSNPPPRSALA